MRHQNLPEPFRLVITLGHELFWHSRIRYQPEQLVEAVGHAVLWGERDDTGDFVCMYPDLVAR
ncbi:MAG: hypothetical protein IPJ48_05225 [Propionivibrio sp.]|uniref:Uncharacterized protein n=1 Tax=Candidatus Propionivibrio dominans TaxID=2954373 RepID=A0A9D7FII7_9RHOO|nr:hypothetical protein [Candidatus Propionivibrio dominans]